MKVLGFSDHVPYPFPKDYFSNFRMAVDQTRDYVETLAALRDEYRGRVDVKIGYEAEFYPLYFDEMRKLVTSYPCDYLILGQHFVGNERNAPYCGVRTKDEAFLRRYVDQCCEGMRTGVYSCLAHPDLLCFEGDDSVFEKEYGRMIECAVDCAVLLEINLLGIRGGRQYPNEKFFALCGKYRAPVCIGADAHEPDVVSDDASYRKALDLVERYGLTLAEEMPLKPVC